MAETDQLPPPPPGFGSVTAIGAGKSEGSTEKAVDLPPPPPGFAPATAVKTATPEFTEPGHTTLGGIEGAITRGLAPMAAGAGLGAAIGAPIGGVGALPGAAVGAGAMGATELATSLYNPLAEHFGWPKTATPQEMTDRILDAFGVARPTTGIERGVEAATGGAAGALGPVKAAETIAEHAASPVVKSVAKELAASPTKQMISGATGGAAAQTAAEAGAGPIGQFVAGLAGGGIPFGRKAAISAAVPSRVTDNARTAIEHGYVIPPSEAVPLGERPGMAASVLGGQSGKIATWQAASTKNQINTNRLAAEAIGLHPDTPLTDIAIKQAKQPADAVYREVESAVPEVKLAGDPSYRRSASQIGSGKSLVEKFFPRTSNNPSIRDLRRDLLANENVPTPVAMKMISDLRFNASQNLRAIGDAQKHALGLAQRSAANLLEEAIDNSVRNAPDYYAAKFNEALVERGKASAEVGKINTALTKAAGTLATNANIYTVGSAMKAARDAKAALEGARQRMERATAEAEKWRERLQGAYARDSENLTLADRYRDARRLFAKIYNIEDATNPTTHNVSAAGLARLYNKGAPLTGKLKVIADSYNTAPKAMQVPELFGHSQDWSALDFFGTMGSIAAGHPKAALAIVGRPVARSTILSKPYQRGMIGEEAVGSPLSLMMNPGAASIVNPDNTVTPTPFWNSLPF